MTTAYLVLIGGAVLCILGVAGLQSWRRIDSALDRLSARVGWPTKESTAVRRFFAVVLIIGVGWLIAGIVHL